MVCKQEANKSKLAVALLQAEAKDSYSITSGSTDPYIAIQAAKDREEKNRDAKDDLSLIAGAHMLLGPHLVQISTSEVFILNPIFVNIFRREK